jgi:hypothetical protein
LDASEKRAALHRLNYVRGRLPEIVAERNRNRTELKTRLEEIKAGLEPKQLKEARMRVSYIRQRSQMLIDEQRAVVVEQKDLIANLRAARPPAAG